MKILHLKYCIAFLILISTSNCESDVNLVKMPEFKQKLVITSYISPSDKITYFSVSSNKKIFGELNTEEPLGLISGSISDGLNEAVLDTCIIGLKLSHEKMQISFGKSYKLKVTTEMGLFAEAECTVPAKKNFSIDVDTFSVVREYPDYYTPHPGGDSYRAIDFKVSFTDLPGEENYYRIMGTFVAYYNSNNPSRVARSSGGLGIREDFISDKGMDGKSIVVMTENHFNNLFPPNLDSMFIKIYLFNTEKSYYKFHKSLRDYYYGEDNPFTEASPVFSNIIGGFGIFTSYTVDSLVVRLK